MKSFESMHDDSLEKYWQKDAEALGRIYQDGMTAYVEDISNLAELFELKKRAVRCIDEGIRQDGISLAGSGALLDEETALRVLREAKATGVTSHEGCGAVALACQQKGIDPKGAEQYAQEWARHLAEAAGLPYEGHIPLSDMARPPHAHIARTVYYDGTGSLALSGKDKFPTGFIISRKYLDPVYAQKELGVAISIALSDHGFGKMITDREPLVVVPIAEDEKLLEHYALEAQAIADEKEGRVIVSGFMAPQKLGS